MSTSWVVTASAGRAVFFSQASNSDSLTYIHDMTNSDAHDQAADLETDRLGQRSASNSIHSVGAPTQPNGYEPNQGPIEHQTELFARGVANYLLEAQQKDRFQQLTLVASPQFLGVLRKLLDPNVTAAITSEINKDYTHFDNKELHKRIEAQLSA